MVPLATKAQRGLCLAAATRVVSKPTYVYILHRGSSSQDGAFNKHLVSEILKCTVLSTAFCLDQFLCFPPSE